MRQASMVEGMGCNSFPETSSATSRKTCARKVLNKETNTNELMCYCFIMYLLLFFFFKDPLHII